MTYSLQSETRDAIGRVPAGVVSGAAMRLGEQRGEPLLVALDGLLRYAHAYRARFEQPLNEDYVLGPEWLAAVKGLRGLLLNGDGAVAMELGRTTDSKDNGALESVFWAAMAVAGFEESDL